MGSLRRKEGEEEMNNGLKDILTVGLFCIMFVLVFIALVTIWNFGKRVNYELAYKSFVKETIIEMVNPESLK